MSQEMRCPNCFKTVKSNETCQCGFQHYENEFRITEMFVYVSVDENGNEGVVTLNSHMGPILMVALDREHMKMYRDYAKMVAKNSRIKVRLLKFSNRHVLESF